MLQTEPWAFYIWACIVFAILNKDLTLFFADSGLSCKLKNIYTFTGLLTFTFYCKILQWISL
jgi:hypothetical protein